MSHPTYSGERTRHVRQISKQRWNFLQFCIYIVAMHEYVVQNPTHIFEHAIYTMVYYIYLCNLKVYIYKCK